MSLIRWLLLLPLTLLVLWLFIYLASRAWHIGKMRTFLTFNPKRDRGPH